MTSLVEKLDERFYPDAQRNWDDRLFRERILAQLNSESVLLDLGAGAGIVEAMNFRGIARRVAGIDLDPRVLQNPFLDEAAIGSADALPYLDNTFDVVIADNVFEHLPAPAAVMREIARVLRPGGRCLIKTPNAVHYMPVIARLTPHRFHAWYNRLRGRPAADTFPTLYRANTEKSLKKLAHESGLNLERIDHLEGRPEYLRLNAILYLLGIAYEKFVNFSGSFANFRILLIAEFGKPEVTTA